MKKQKKKKCIVCGKLFSTESSLQKVCTFDCAVSNAETRLNKKSATARKKAIKAAKKDKRAYNKSDIRWQHKQTQTKFNRMRVLEELLYFKERGEEPICISCGKGKGNDVWCCGHFKTRKARPDLRYDKKNTFLQHNFRCNSQLSGDIDGYKKGLVHRFGEKEGKAIIEYCESPPGEQMDCEQLEKFRAACAVQIKVLELQLGE